MRVDLIQPAEGQLVTPGEAAAFARAPAGDAAELWPGWILTATQLAQEWTARQFLEATFERVLCAFPAWGESIVLAPAPLRDVVSVTYRDLAGVVQTLPETAYTVSAPGGPQAERGSVWASTWPATAEHPEAVRVRFKAGYGATLEEVLAVVPQVRHALLKGVAEAYARREVDDILRAMVPTLEPLQIPWAYSS